MTLCVVNNREKLVTRPTGDPKSNEKHGKLITGQFFFILIIAPLRPQRQTIFESPAEWVAEMALASPKPGH